MKIIPPSKKCSYIERIWHHVNERFTSPSTLRGKLTESFSEQVPDTCNYQVGYFEKRHNKKYWIEGADDLNCMYASHESHDTIKLWCDGREEQNKSTSHIEKGGKKKTICDKGACRECSSKFDSTVQELVDKHGENYTEAQLRVWARLIVNGIHKDTDNPPDIPIITGEPAKKKKRLESKRDDSFTDVLKTAVSIFADKFTPGQTAVSPKTTSGISPATKAKLSSSIP